MKYAKGQKVRCVHPTCLLVLDKVYEVEEVEYLECEEVLIYVRNEMGDILSYEETRFVLEKETMKYNDAQEVMVEFFGLKVGDTIKILRAAKTNENGWSLTWSSPDMDRDVGREFKIQRIDPYKGINYKSCFWVPFFVIEKIVPKPVEIKLSADYTASIENGVTKVGCQTIPFEVLEEVYNAAKKQVG